MTGIRRFAKEVVFCAMGIDENFWKESSIFHKVGDVIATMLLITYTIILPALIFIALWIES